MNESLRIATCVRVTAGREANGSASQGNKPQTAQILQMTEAKESGKWPFFEIRVQTGCLDFRLSKTALKVTRSVCLRAF